MENEQKLPKEVTEIICRHCKKDTGITYERFKSYLTTYITKDIKCPHCKKSIIKANKFIFEV